MSQQPPRPPESPTGITQEKRPPQPPRGQQQPPPIPNPRPPHQDDPPYVVDGGNPMTVLLMGGGLVFVCLVVACVALFVARDRIEDLLGLDDSADNQPINLGDQNTGNNGEDGGQGGGAEQGSNPTPTGLPGLSSTRDPGNVTPPSGDLLFVSNRSGQWEIWVMGADGRNPMQITRNSPDVNYSPGWSPDGRLIVFEARRDNNWDIYVMNSDGSNIRRLTTDAAVDRVPSWSPDGRTIAFASDRYGDDDIFLMNPDGSNLRQITFAGSDEYYPEWSPDGQEVVYQSNRTGTLQIYRQRIDQRDSAAQQLTFGGANKGAASWSPDGSTIVFYTNVGVGAGQDIYTVSAAGGELGAIAANSYNEVAPTWDATGRYVYYHAGTRGGTNILRVDVQTGAISEITQRGDRNWSPNLKPATNGGVVVNVPAVVVQAPSEDTQAAAPDSSANATVFCPNTAPGLLSVGQAVVRAEGTNPALYGEASTQGRRISDIVSAMVMRVINGPRCSEAETWWYVDYGLTAGWTRETVGQTYQLRSIEGEIAGLTVPSDRSTAPANARLLTGGVGLSNNSAMAPGEFQVEWYCNILGYGVGTDGQYWYCTVEGVRLARLSPSDFDAICQASYNNPRAFAIQNGTGEAPAYRWLCYGG